MKDRPLLCNEFSVRGILDGRKTQTRRVVKPQPLADNTEGVYADLYNHEPNHWAFWLPDNRMTEPRVWPCPYGQVGDRLWARETFHYDEIAQRYYYKADIPFERFGYEGNWTPSVFMPRWASRLTLEIVKVRVERVQEISQGDCIAEGLDLSGWKLLRRKYQELWDSINGKKYPWSSNSWVWVIEFKKI